MRLYLGHYIGDVGPRTQRRTSDKDPMPQAQPDLLLNHRYRLSVRIGQGGMGEVWKANDEAHGARTVAVKMMPADLDANDRRRFEREVRILREVHHPHVVPLIDLGWHNESLFYVMEYIGPFTL